MLPDTMVALVTAREKRDAARALLAEGRNPLRPPRLLLAQQLFEAMARWLALPIDASVMTRVHLPTKREAFFSGNPASADL